MAVGADSILIATTNPAKAARLRWVLQELGSPYRELDGGQPAPEETGSTFKENAELKAIYWSATLGGFAVASDGGLAIPALGDAWEALRTGRAAGVAADDLARAQHLLSLARDLRGAERQVFWREGLALARDGQLLASWESHGTQALLVKEFSPSDLKPGFWAASLCLVPGSGQTLASLGDSELFEHDPTWSGLRSAVQAWWQERLRASG